MAHARGVLTGLALRLSAVGLVLALGAGCGSGAEDPEPSPTGAGTSAGSDSSAAPAPEDPIVERCRSRAPEEVAYEARRLESGPVEVDAVLVRPVKSNGRGVVLFPQVTAGLCGGLPFAEQLALEGFTVYGVDACGYDESTCEAEVSATQEVSAAYGALREEIGPKAAIAAVGASMGGHVVAEAALADEVDLSAWVDLSGPATWNGVDLLKGAKPARIPGLIVFARSDDALRYREARRLADVVGARFMSAGAGHGWETVADYEGGLSRVGKAVVAFLG